MNHFLLVVAAIIPAVVLCVYVFMKDRVDKEPISLLFRLLLLGIAACFPASYVESFTIDILDGVFADSIFTDSYGNVMISESVFYIYNFIKYFLCVALTEELCKWIVLNFATKLNKEFNCFFDGLIYSVFVSLGFAAFENVFYVIDYGWYTALMRAFLSVPGHMFFAVMMGYQYSVSHIIDGAWAMESVLKDEGLIPANAPEFTSRKNMILSVAVPALAHGIYDYCCTLGTAWATVIFYLFVGFMYIKCFGKIKKMSFADAPGDDYSKAMVISKYPMLTDKIIEMF